MNFRPSNSQEASINRTRGVDISLFMSRVYGWMMLGIFLTGLVSFLVGNNPELVTKIFMNKPFFWAVIIVQFLAVIYLSAMINRISAPAAAITFLMYSALTGLTLSMIFVLYSQESIASAFAVTAISFGGLSMYGYVTRRDLGPIGSFCIMGLFGVIGLIVLSLFIPGLRSDTMQMVISVAGIIIFAGLTAYDTQRIKNLANSPDLKVNQQAIYGALILYLDFINLFLNLLRLMGQRR
jgi:FtsH-binding integral membrane protein